jgi:hypothetical protein
MRCLAKYRVMGVADYNGAYRLWIQSPADLQKRPSPGAFTAIGETAPKPFSMDALVMEPVFFE